MTAAHLAVRRRLLPVPGTTGVVAMVAAVLLGISLVVAGLPPLVSVAVPLVLAAVAVCFRRPALLVLLLSALLPFGEHVILDQPVALQLIDVGSASIVALTLLIRCNARELPLRIPQLAGWLAGFVAIALVSTTQSIDVSASFTQVIQLVVGVFLALAVGSSVRSAADRLLVLSGFATIGAVVCVVSLRGASQIRLDGSASLIDNRITGIFAQPNNFGSFAAVVLTIGIGLVLSGRRGLVRAAGWFAVLGGVAGVGVALSRGSMIGAALALLAFIVFVPAVRMRLLLVGVAVILVLTIAGTSGIGPSPLQNAGKRLTTIVTGNENPQDERPAIWAEAVREIAARPLLGFGPSSFAVASSREHPAGIEPEASTSSDPTAPVIGADHAHDVLLTIGAETGVVGLALALAFTIRLGYALLRLKTAHPDRTDLPVIAAIAGALLTFVGQGLVDFTLRDPVLSTTLWIMVGLAFGAIGADRDASRAKVRI